MQPTLQPSQPTQSIDPQSDPHDAIVALMRGHHSAPRWSDPSELNFTPVDDANAATAPASSIESALGTQPAPPIDAPLPSAFLNDKIDIVPERAPQARAARGLTRFVLTVFAGIVATIGWQAYGDEAREMFATVAPQLLAQVSGQAQTSTEPQTAEPAQAAQPADAPATAQPATDVAAAPAQPADAATAPTATAPAQPDAAAAAQPAPAAPPVAESAPAQAAMSPEVTQQLDSMSREIATLKQTIEQLKAEKQQLSREAAAAKAQEPKRKTSAQTPKPAPPQRAAAAPSPQPVSTTPRSTQPTPQPQPYGQGQAYRGQAYPSQQTYGQAQAYPPRQTYGQAQAYPPPPTYGQAYPQGPVQRDDVYVPPPRTLPPEPGFGPTPRPPMPLQ